MKLYSVLIDNDATMLEINPMTEDSNGQGIYFLFLALTNVKMITVYCMDVKINIDDNASYRQTELFKLRDFAQEDPHEVEASQCNLNYIQLDGSIGCVGKYLVGSRWLLLLNIVFSEWGWPCHGNNGCY